MHAKTLWAVSNLWANHSLARARSELRDWLTRPLLGSQHYAGLSMRQMQIRIVINYLTLVDPLPPLEFLLQIFPNFFTVSNLDKNVQHNFWIGPSPRLFDQKCPPPPTFLNAQKSLWIYLECLGGVRSPKSVLRDFQVLRFFWFGRNKIGFNWSRPTIYETDPDWHADSNTSFGSPRIRTIGLGLFHKWPHITFLSTHISFWDSGRCR